MPSGGSVGGKSEARAVSGVAGGQGKARVKGPVEDDRRSV